MKLVIAEKPSVDEHFAKWRLEDLPDDRKIPHCKQFEEKFNKV